MSNIFDKSKYKSLKSSSFNDIKLIKKGKVREVYELEDNYLIVASDRISAFDVIMEEVVPTKGVILNLISQYWFDFTNKIIDNHLITINIEDYPYICHKYKEDLYGRSMLIKKTKPLPVEFVVRGYLAGSGWKEYKNTGEICGIKLPDGLKEYDKLEYPIFTPASKNDIGHDENISYEKYIEILGQEIGDKLKDISLQIYNLGYQKMIQKGIILVDTKFEYGVDLNNEIILIDEVLTPDSSRYWLLEDYKPGVAQINFDKQILRDYLETLDWNKQYPPPSLPEDIINRTLEKYIQAYNLILSN